MSFTSFEWLSIMGFMLIQTAVIAAKLSGMETKINIVFEEWLKHRKDK